MKNLIFLFVGLISLSIIIFFTYMKNSSITVQYAGLGESDQSLYTVNNYLVNKISITTDSPNYNSDEIEFVQRNISGGGSNPGWVISLTETQPNIFTGRIIVDDGVYQHPVTLKEEPQNVFLGAMLSVEGRKETFSMKKIDKECVDEEKNTYEYSLSGTYGAKQFSGCGGIVLKQAK